MYLYLLVFMNKLSLEIELSELGTSTNGISCGNPTLADDMAPQSSDSSIVMSTEDS